MTTTPEVRTDEQIQQDVLAELRWDARVQPDEVAVAVRGGVVTLAGWVDNYVKRWAAERAAQRVRGRGGGHGRGAVRCSERGM